MKVLLTGLMLLASVRSAYALTPEECAAELSVLPKVTADFFIKQKRLPDAGDLARRLPRGFDFENFDAMTVLRNSAADLPDLLRDEWDKAAEQSAAFYGAHLRWPSREELAEKLAWREPGPRRLELQDLLLGPLDTFNETAARRHRDQIIKAMDKVVTAYLRALSQRDRPKHLKTQASSPQPNEIIQALLRSKLNYDLQADYFTGVFNEAVFDGAVKYLFTDGYPDLELAARAASPARFANFRPIDSVSQVRAQRLKAALETGAGFLVTSVNAGIPLNEDMFALMLKYSEDRGYDLIIYPTNGQTEGIDRRLLDNPRIHLMTHTIQNRFLKLSNIGIMPKNQNPFASLNKFSQFIPGQLSIVGHPQLAHEVLPTSSNHVRPTGLWSTGSLSQNLYPYAYPVQARTSYLAKNFHVNSFLVLEKSDRDSGLNRRGTQNFWHVRPVEFAGESQDEAPGFNDLGTRYLRRGGQIEVTRQDPIGLVKGDLHELIADQGYLLAYRELLSRFSPGALSVILHDPMDNSSSNRHELDKPSILIRKFASGELNVANEIAGLVQFDNALAAIPSVRNRIYDDSNHSYWLRDLLDRRPPTQSVINGQIMAELTFARDVLGIGEPLEYILNHRHRFIEGLPPTVRRDFEEKEIFTRDPQNARVMPFGEPMVYGPEWRPVHLNNHGHQGTNGARPSGRAHAAGQQRAITGDSHRSAIMGGWFNVGTSTPKRVGYNNGGYSSWSNSAALVYPDGTIQLLTYEPVAGTLYARPGHGTLPAADFFGDDPLKIEPNDNDILPLGEVYDQFHEWSSRRRAR